MSRALDALVAERVMGWKPCGPECDGKHGECYWIDNDGSVWLHGGMVAFRPSEDNGDTHKILNKIGNWPVPMMSREPLWTLEETQDRDAWVWRVRFTKNYGLQWSAHHTKFAMAVCIAALRAVGVSEEEIEKARKAT